MVSTNGYQDIASEIYNNGTKTPIQLFFVVYADIKALISWYSIIVCHDIAHLFEIYHAMELIYFQKNSLEKNFAVSLFLSKSWN